MVDILSLPSALDMQHIISKFDRFKGVAVAHHEKEIVAGWVPNNGNGASRF